MTTITIDRAIVEQALAALESERVMGVSTDGEFAPTEVTPKRITEAISALRAALAAPQTEPVAWIYTLEYGASVANTKVSVHQLNYPFGVCGADYLAQNSDGVSYVRQTPLYAAPPARKPLTIEQMAKVFADSGLPIDDGCEHHFDIARATERAHGITE